jgi:hypothetical protein
VLLPVTMKARMACILSLSLFAVGALGQTWYGFDGERDELN